MAGFSCHILMICAQVEWRNPTITGRYTVPPNSLQALPTALDQKEQPTTFTPSFRATGSCR
eukprot:scaffold598160_cov45-Prasinocladus_malaysianus.AAC.1